jgi:hypothetical protein
MSASCGRKNTRGSASDPTSQYTPRNAPHPSIKHGPRRPEARRCAHRETIQSVPAAGSHMLWPDRRPPSHGSAQLASPLFDVRPCKQATASVPTNPRPLRRDGRDTEKQREVRTLRPRSSTHCHGFFQFFVMKVPPKSQRQRPDASCLRESTKYNPHTG